VSGLKKAYGGGERERGEEKESKGPGRGRGRGRGTGSSPELERKGVKDWNSLGACGVLLLSYRYPVPAHIIFADSFVFSFALPFFIRMDDRMTG